MPAMPNTTPAAAEAKRPKVPDLDGVDVTFGNIKHLPPYDATPEEFRRERGDARPYCDFVRQWFFSGLNQEDMARLATREGIERKKALNAIKAILVSFEPKHEHKEAGAAYLLSQWFVLAPKAE